MRFFKWFFNREKIEDLELELRSLELRLPSMEDRAVRSRETARFAEENFKSGFGKTDLEIAQSVQYYRNDAEADEAEVSEMKFRILEIKSELERLGR